MDIKAKTYTIKEIKFVLIFFLLCLILKSCKNDTLVYPKIEVNYVNGKALSVSIKGKRQQEYKVFLKGESEIAVLGSFNNGNSEVRFRPAVPFTPGLTYEVQGEEGIIGEFSIKEHDTNTLPSIVTIYPTIDTVPENLLKMYIEFSEPMQATGSSLDFIEVWDQTDNERTELFLALENELWNKDHTMLTLWLDPGRIKQDLIPNMEKGNPLKKGHNYELIFSNSWKSETGKQLDSTYSKWLVVEEKDIEQPTVDSWKLIIPAYNSLDSLYIDFNEILDSQLLLNSISVFTAENETFQGDFTLSNKERGVYFKPSKPWLKGNYTIKIEARLEDLAGNNLSRLFDTDLSTTVSGPQNDRSNKEIKFKIK